MPPTLTLDELKRVYSSYFTSCFDNEAQNVSIRFLVNNMFGIQLGSKYSGGKLKFTGNLQENFLLNQVVLINL